MLEHRGCGGAVDEHRICETCGEPLGARDIEGTARPGSVTDSFHYQRAMAAS